MMLFDVMNRIQISSFDLFILLIDLAYIGCIAFLFIYFAKYFIVLDVKFLEDEKLDTHHYILISSYTFAILIIIVNILNHATNESLIGALFSVITYTILMIGVLLSRKPISMINNASLINIEYTKKQYQTYQLYDAYCFVSSGIMIGAVLFYFYEMNISSIFLICIFVEFTLEICTKLITRFVRTSIKEVVLKCDLNMLYKFVAFRVHFSLLFISSACIIDINDSATLEMLCTILMSLVTVLMLSSLIFVACDKFLEIALLDRCLIKKDKKFDLLPQSILMLGIDICLMIILN